MPTLRKTLLMNLSFIFLLHLYTRLISMASGNERNVSVPKDLNIHVRNVHTDMEVPDFSYYRRSSTKDSSAKNQETTDR